MTFLLGLDLMLITSFNKKELETTFNSQITDDIIEIEKLIHQLEVLIMLSIGEFSKIAKVSVKTLRHYDQIGLLNPQNVDYLTGYRKYSILQLTRLNKILFYKDIGFSLKQIYDLIDEEITVEQMKILLKKNEQKLENDIKNAKRNLETIRNRIKLLETKKTIPEYEIKHVESKLYRLVSRRFTIPTVDQITFYSNKLYDSLYKELSGIGIQPIGPEMNLYHNKEYTETDLDMEFAVAIAGTKEELQKLKNSDLIYTELSDKNQIISLTFSGNFHDLDIPIIEMMKWIETNNLEIAGELRELHLSGPAHVNGELQKEAAVELQLPVKRIKS